MIFNKKFDSEVYIDKRDRNEILFDWINKDSDTFRGDFEEENGKKDKEIKLFFNRNKIVDILIQLAKCIKELFEKTLHYLNENNIQSSRI